MSVHSPQPWSYISCGSKHAKQRFIIDANGRLISHWPSEADATLMAAAPELLSALQNLLVIAGTPITERQESIFRDARAAIAKARTVSGPSSLPLLAGEGA